MARNAITKTLRDGTITISDGSTITKSMTVAIEIGDLSFDIPGREVLDFLDRNKFSSTSTPAVRYGKDQPMSGSFTCYLRDFVDDAGSAAIIEELVLLGKPTNWETTLGADATTEVFTVDIAFTMEGSDHGDTGDGTLTFPYCVVRGSIAEGDPSTVSFSWTSYALYPTVTDA